MKDIIIKVGNEHYLFVVNRNTCFFNSSISISDHEIIKFSELTNHINSNSDKIKLSHCLHLDLYELDRKLFEETKTINTHRGERHSLDEVETFHWLVTQGVDIRLNNDFIVKWAHHFEKKELIDYFKKVPIQDVPNPTQDISKESNTKEKVISHLTKLIMKNFITPEQRQFIIHSLMEVVLV